MMAGDRGNQVRHGGELGSGIRAEVSEHGAVDGMLAVTTATTEHLLEGVGVLAVIMEQSGKGGEGGKRSSPGRADAARCRAIRETSVRCPARGCHPTRQLTSDPCSPAESAQ